MLGAGDDDAEVGEHAHLDSLLLASLPPAQSLTPVDADSALGLPRPKTLTPAPLPPPPHREGLQAGLRRDRRCAAYSFNTRSGMCYLKEEAGPLRRYADTVTGVKRRR
jgi:hypothetical protein